MSTITTQAGRAVKASRLRWREQGGQHTNRRNPISHTEYPETSDAPAPRRAPPG